MYINDIRDYTDACLSLMIPYLTKEKSNSEDTVNLNNNLMKMQESERKCQMESIASNYSQSQIEYSSETYIGVYKYRMEPLPTRRNKLN